MPDVIVVGLGAMGSSALYQLSRRGMHVLGLEALQPGHELGSSHGESRIIRLAYHEHPSYVPLLRRAYDLWSELEGDAGERLLTITGGLMIGLPESEVVSGARASATQHGLEHELLLADEVRGRFPALHLAEDEVALWEPASGFLRPELCIDALMRLARRAGAEAHYEERVQSWRASGDGVDVVTDRDTYHADQVVFTCGARMNAVLGDAAPRVTAERAVLFWLEPSAPALFAEGRLPIYIWETSSGDAFYGFPHVEWAGTKVSRHHSGQMCDPETVDRTVYAADEADLRNLIAQRMPDLNGAVLASRVCLYENSADRHFLVDRLPEHPNVIYAGGFSGHGFKFASVIGEILADLVTRGQATPDADFLRVRAERFASSD
jgi:sarcosine oxidase